MLCNFSGCACKGIAAVSFETTQKAHTCVEKQAHALPRAQHANSFPAATPKMEASFAKSILPADFPSTSEKMSLILGRMSGSSFGNQAPSPLAKPSRRPVDTACFRGIEESNPLWAFKGT